MVGRGLDSRHPLLIAGVAAGILVFDQVSKSWAVSRLSDDSTIDLVGSLRFNLAFNTGAAFSQGTGMGPVIGLIAIAVVIVLVWTSRSATSRLSAVAVGLVVGGALGNVADRMFRDGPGGFFGGAVVDFIDLQWWPIFNVADSAVVVGGILLLVATLRAGDQEGLAEEEGSEEEPVDEATPAAGDDAETTP